MRGEDVGGCDGVRCDVCVVLRKKLDFFFQAEDGIRDLVRSRGLGDVYKRQEHARTAQPGEVCGLGAVGSKLSAISHRPSRRRLGLSLIHI